MYKAITLAVLFLAGANAQAYSSAAVTLTNWTTVNIPAVTCTADSTCQFLTNATYGFATACCATWKSQPLAGGNITTLGNTCISQDVDFYTAPFQTNTSNVWMNCTINATWANYTPSTWKAVNQVSCTANSQCSTGQCCNNNNGTYSGLTNSNWEPDNFCMSSSADTTLYNWNGPTAATTFSVAQMCLSTSQVIAQVPATPSTSGTTGTKSSSSSLLISAAAVVIVAASAMF